MQITYVGCIGVSFSLSTLASLPKLETKESFRQLGWLPRCHVKSQEGRSYDGKLRPESDSDTQTSFTFASVSECEECLGHNVSDVTLCNTTKTSAPAPSARILASDWLRVII